MRLLALFAVLVLAAGGRAVAAPPLVADLSSSHINITTGFTGTQLLLFGATEGVGDIVVVVRGPKRQEVVRRKERIAGIWVNYGAAELDNVPGYYAVASTRPLEVIAPPAVLDRYGIGTTNLGFRPVEGSEANGRVEPFVDAAIRIRSNEALYREHAGGVLFLGSSLFRASFEMPANVPDGRYTARVYLFGDGNVLQAQTSTLFVTKIGFERLVYDFAHDQPLAYGLAAVLVACLAGWAASAVFRRS